MEGNLLSLLTLRDERTLEQTDSSRPKEPVLTVVYGPADPAPGWEREL